MFCPNSVPPEDDPPPEVEPPDEEARIDDGFLDAGIFCETVPFACFVWAVLDTLAIFRAIIECLTCGGLQPTRRTVQCY